LLFIILTDALHDGLELNPFTERRHGCRLTYKTGDVEQASLGNADDTAAITNTLDDLRVQNDWVQYFMRFNVLRLNPLKCELVARGADGRAVSNAAVAHHGIAVDSLVLSPLSHNLNETLTSYDRQRRLAPVGSHAAAAATPSPTQCLIDEGFTDVYRLLPDARRQPGFTHFIDSTTQCSRSRIDYIWTRGASAASHLDIRIDAKLRDISHHRLVWMELHLQREPSPPCYRPLYHMKLPNLVIYVFFARSARLLAHACYSRWREQTHT
jgi:hypothetical protein